jgi:hypothetical protein
MIRHISQYINDVDMYEGRPSIDVKDLHNPHPYTDLIEERFKCTRRQAENAAEWAYDNARDEFWDDVKLVGVEILGVSAFDIEGWGRSGGHLVVNNYLLTDENFAKWQKFEEAVIEIYKELSDPDHILDQVDVNRYAEEGAERSNWRLVAKSDGTKIPVCVIDIKKVADKAVQTYVDSLEPEGCVEP